MISRLNGDFLILETLSETFPRILEIVQHRGEKEITFMVPVMLDHDLCEVMEELEGRKLTYKDKFPVTFNPKDPSDYPHGDYYRVRLVHDVSITIHESGC